jgi:hypothetical protein
MGIVTFLLGLVGGWRAFLGVAMMAIVGIVLYNLLVDVVEELLQFVVNQISGITVPGAGMGAVTYSGFAAWLATGLKLPECLSAVVATVSIGWVLRKIPFIRW